MRRLESLKGALFSVSPKPSYPPASLLVVALPYSRKFRTRYTSNMANTGDHSFIPAKDTDSRSPCPALNALANHGYLPRDGMNISFMQLYGAITNVYGVSGPVTAALSAGGIALCGHGLKLDLAGLCKHNAIEHDGSICHRDVSETGGTVASNRPDPELVKAIIDSSNGQVITLEDLIRAKVRRETDHYVKYPGEFLTRVSRGELPLAVTVMQGETYGIPVDWFKEWVQEERLPDGYLTKRKLTLLHIVKETETVMKSVNTQVAAIEKERKNT